jgi:hypothetical protein
LPLTVHGNAVDYLAGDPKSDLFSFLPSSVPPTFPSFLPIPRPPPHAAIFLPSWPQPPKCWDYRCVPPCPAAYFLSAQGYDLAQGHGLPFRLSLVSSETSSPQGPASLLLGEDTSFEDADLEKAPDMESEDVREAGSPETGVCAERGLERRLRRVPRGDREVGGRDGGEGWELEYSARGRERTPGWVWSWFYFREHKRHNVTKVLTTSSRIIHQQRPQLKFYLCALSPLCCSWKSRHTCNVADREHSANNQKRHFAIK